MWRSLIVVVVAACGNASLPARPVAPATAQLATTTTRPEACANPQSAFVVPDVNVTTIDPGGVMRAINGHRGELRRCFERFLKRETRSGSVIATFAVLDDGSVGQVRVHGLAESLDRCLCTVVANVQFPPQRGTAIVRYPMQFSGAM